MTIYACPKPPKGRPKRGKVQRVNKSDGKEAEICRSPEAWEERRGDVGERAGWRCENKRCRAYAPLHDEQIERGENEMPVLIHAGHAAHVTPRRMGGGSRDDSHGNLMWLCWVCHHLQTVGRLTI
jgi:hypothetical protein